MKMAILLPIFFPILAGAVLLILPNHIFSEKKRFGRICLFGCMLAVLLISGLFAVYDVCFPDREETASGITLFYLTKTIPIYFRVDGIGRLFVSIVTVVWVLAGIYSFEYMKHDKNEKRYYAFYLMTYGVLVGLDFSGNLITMYLFYELMTLASLPLVLHNGSHEAIMAGLKYLLYSLFGAYMALFGVYFLYHYCTTITFTAGGCLDFAKAAGHEGFLLVVVFCMIAGFGVKAGMFPMHAWLPTAHPVAPSPASGVLSGIIVKSGVLAIIRVVYYLVGPSFIQGTWVQTAWLVLALITVFMGSMLAYREQLFKKRLAYSTVSQVSYILFGLALCNQTAMTGALLHVVFHAFIKSALFLCVGAVIHKTGKAHVQEMTGIGKEMPVVTLCYTIASLALIGIPPASGFISKWYLATGALESEISVFSWLGPVILLISALLTAGYLLPTTVKGFLPGNDFDYKALKNREPSAWIVVPVLVLAGLALGLGIIPMPLIEFIQGTVTGLF